MAQSAFVESVTGHGYGQSKQSASVSAGIIWRFKYKEMATGNILLGKRNDNLPSFKVFKVNEIAQNGAKNEKML
ncbi:MAG TPA: hypothetical protein VG097_14115 [Gemmata sp.]|jgi:hypothetical protein|nr:hypothetical protein [Gemmata sp.]